MLTIPESDRLCQPGKKRPARFSVCIKQIEACIPCSLVAPTTVSPAPATEQKQHHKNNQYGFHCCTSRGVRRFCPRFFEMGTTDKRTFWAYFFQALAGAEAGLNPNTSIRHTEPEGAMALRSEGLLQLAYADHKRYGCDFNWQVDRALRANDPAKTILQPKNNLECGVKILVNQTIVHHKPLLTRSGYWSTLRPDGLSFRVFAKQMTNPPAACSLPTKSTIDKSATTKSVQHDANRQETPK